MRSRELQRTLVVDKISGNSLVLQCSESDNNLVAGMAHDFNCAAFGSQRTTYVIDSVVVLTECLSWSVILVKVGDFVELLKN